MAKSSPHTQKKEKRPKIAVSPRRINASTLRKLIADIPKRGERGYINDVISGLRLSAYIFQEFLGPEWVEYYIANKGLLQGSTYFGNPDLFPLRSQNLAEMLLNLQDVPGIVGCIKLLAGGQIEAAYAELEAAKYLVMAGVRFEINEASGTRKSDYDLKVWFQNGEVGCAETKCKSEGNPLREETVINSLIKARKQLPSDLPLVIFMKIPEDWNSNQSMDHCIRPAVNKYLQGSDTVVAVELFESKFQMISPIAAEQSFTGVEVINAHHKFDNGKSWSLIGSVPPATNLPLPFWWRGIPVLVNPSVNPRLFSG